jgi:hypothetical protein
MKRFVFVDDSGQLQGEWSATADTEKEARKQVWDSLNEEQQNACGCLDCVDELPE